MVETEFNNDNWTWKWGKEKVNWGIENDFIVFKESKNKSCGWTVFYKNYLLVDNKGEKLKRSSPYKNMITDIKTGDGAKRIVRLFGSHVFKYTKPVELITILLKMIEMPKNAIILDFFAGSGTTGNAILELNKESNGEKRFILCTDNESNICTDICYPRIKKVINGYKFKIKNNRKKTQTEKKIEGLGGGLTYYKIDQMEKEPNSELSVPPLITDANKKRMITKVTELLCMKEWCFDLVYQNNSSIPKFSIYKNNNGDYIGIIYDSDSVLQFIKKIDKMTEIKKINTYVFSDIMSSAIRKNKKIKFESIPTEILGVWNRIFESNIHKRRSIK